MTKARVTALLGTFVLILGGMFTGAATAHADDTLVTCLGGEIEIYVNEYNDDAVTVEGTFTDCFSLFDEDIESATISGSGHATVNTILEVVVTTTDTITWNTSDTTTLTEVRTVTGLHSVLGVGVGATVSDLFHPSTDTAAGTGTRTNSPGGVECHIEWHVEMGL